MVGVAFNNRQLLGGFAGEIDALPRRPQPVQFSSAGKMWRNCYSTLTGCRILRAPKLQKVPAFGQASFATRFPEEGRPGRRLRTNMDLLINDNTVLASEGDLHAKPWSLGIRPLTSSWPAINSAPHPPASGVAPKLFFTARDQWRRRFASPATAGPMLNKQAETTPERDREPAQFVEENFFNIGLSDHPVQALNRLARNDPNFIDNGRREITGRDSDIYKVPRPRRCGSSRAAGFFFHNGAFTNVERRGAILQRRCATEPGDRCFGGRLALPTRAGPGFPPAVLGLTEDESKRNHRFPGRTPFFDPRIRQLRSELNDNKRCSRTREEPDLLGLQAGPSRP